MPKPGILSRRRERAWVLTLGSIAVAGAASGVAADTWDAGTSGSGGWSGAINWADDSEPGNGDPVIFPAPFPLGLTSIALSGTEHAASVTFNDAYTLHSAILTLHGAGGQIGVVSGKTATINSSVAGTVGLSKTGSGNLTLFPTGNNTFSGPVEITGTLNINKDSSLGNAANPVLLTPGVTTGTLRVTTTSFSTSRVITVGPFGGTISVDFGRTYTVNAGLGSTFNGPLNVTGAGTLWLNNFSSRSGSTTIQNGTVHLNTAFGLGSGGSSISNNGTLELGLGVLYPGTIFLDQLGRVRSSAIGAATGGAVIVQAGASEEVFLNSGDNSTHTLHIGDYRQGTGATTRVNGSGSVILHGSNDYSGAWAVDSGTLHLTNPDSITSISAPIAISSGGAVSAESASNYAGAWATSGLLRVSHAAGLGVGASGVNVNTGGTLQIEGVNVARNATLAGGGTIKGVGNATASGTISAALAVPIVTLATGASSTDTLTVNAYTGGDGSMTRVTGSGEVILTSANPYFGTWDILNGTLRVGHHVALGGNAAPVVIGSGGTLHLKADNPLEHAVTMNNGSTLKGTMTSGGFQPQMQGTVTVASGAQVTFASSSPADVLHVGHGTNTLTGGGGGSTITIAPKSNVLLLNPSNYVGNWIVPKNGSDVATLQFGHDDQLGNPANGVTLSGGVLAPGVAVTTSRQITIADSSTIDAFGTFTLNSGLAGSGTVLSFTGGTTNLNAAATWTGSLVSISGFSTVAMNHASAVGTASISAFDGNLHVGDNVTVNRPLTMNGFATLSGGSNSTYSGTINAPNSPGLKLRAPLASDTFAISSYTGVGSGGITTILGSGTVVLNGSNTYPGKYVVNGGTLKLNHANAVSTSASPLTINTGGTVLGAVASNYAGDWQLNGGTLRAQNATGTGTGASDIVLDTADTLQLESVSFPRAVTLNAGGTLAALGLATYQNNLKVTNSLADVFIHVPGVADRLTFITEIRGVSAAASSATINVTGNGRVLLRGVSPSPTNMFGGSWKQSAGILQVGESLGNSINALGFKNGDAKQANSIRADGGALAVGVLGSGANTPQWLRANVTLNGGAIASTNGVNAQFGGDFIVEAGSTSRVLVYDPVNPATPRHVSIVAGAAGADNLAALTEWRANSTLILDAGTTTGGVFNLVRNGGTISVDPADPTLVINPGVTANLGGSADALSDGVDHVNVVNNTTTTLFISEGPKNIGSLSGTGNTNINSNGSLTIHQDVNTNAGPITGEGALIKEGAGTLTATAVAVASLTVNGGAVISLGEMSIDSGETIALAGGSTSAPSLIDNGSVSVTSGTLALDVLAVGNDGTLSGGLGTGTADVSGGTVSAKKVLLGSSTGGSGTLSVSGTGTLTSEKLAANALVVNGGSVTVTQPAVPEDPVTDGALVAGYVHNGAIIVNGGTVTTPNIKLGVTSGKLGAFNQTGGTVTVTTLGVGNDGTPDGGSGSGVADLTGGTLNVTNLILGSTAGGVGNINGTSGLVASGSYQVLDGSIGVPLGGAVSLTKNGPGFVALSAANTYTGATTVNAGALVMTEGLQSGGPLTIETAAVALIPSAAPDTYDPGNEILPTGNNAKGSRINSLTVNGTGRLDLGNSDLAIDYDGASPLESIAALIALGYNGGTWDGPGLIASTASLDSTVFGLGYAENSQLPDPYNDTTNPFFGIPVDDSTVVVKFTWVGDLNVDGFVNFSDLVVFNGTFDDGATTGHCWFEGDFNYDGLVDFSDLVLFNGAYDENKVSMPEPAGLGGFMMLGLALARRRRCRGSRAGAPRRST